MNKNTSIVFQVVDGQDNLSLTVNLKEAATGETFTATNQAVPTATWAALDTGAVTAPDLLMVKNDDTTNAVQLAIDDAGANAFAELSAGRALFLPCLAGVTYYVNAAVTVVNIKTLSAGA